MYESVQSLFAVFPDYFVNCCTSWQAKQVIEDYVIAVLLSGTTCRADGKFEFEGFGIEFRSGRTVRWGGVNREVSIGRLKDDWVIHGERDRIGT